MMKSKHTLLFILVAALLVLSSFTNVMAQARPKGVKVLGVRVEGQHTADPGLIVANSGLVVGKEVVGDDIQKAIRRIWSLNLFQNVEIYIERQVSDGAFFLVKVAEFPRIDTIEYDGNKKLDDEDINEIMNLYRGQVIRPARLQRSKRELLAKYKEKGYLLANIKVVQEETEDQMRKKIIYKIDEGKKVRIKDIDFAGNNTYDDKVLRKQFKKTKQRGLFRSGAFDREKFEEDLELLTEFYRNHGYRDFEVLNDSIYYSEKNDRLTLQINVKEGTKYFFGGVTFNGNTLYPESLLMSRLAFRPGDTFSAEKLQYTTSERLGNLYYDKGYIYSRVEPQLIPVSDDTLAVKYDIYEGNQFKVRKINILGNTKTKEKVIRREFVLYPGDTFDVSRLRRSVRELTIMNYFGNVMPDVQPVSDAEVDLFIEVEEKPTDQANISAGYSERDGMIGAIGFAMPNFLGNGQRFSLDWNFGKYYRSFSISFTEPWMFNTPTLGGASFYDLRRGGSLYGYRENVTGGSLRIGRRFKWPDDYTRGDWIYKLETTEYSDINDDDLSDALGIKEGVPRWSSSITQIFTRDSRNNPEFPTMGSVFSYSVELAGSILGGEDQYHKHFLSGEWYFPFTEKLVLYSQSRFGLIFDIGDAERNIQAIDYFYLGGSGISFGESLRGYEEGAVGPTTHRGTPLGGKSMFKQTFELRLPIIPNPTVFLLAFAEGGNAWASRGEMDLNDLRRSAGLGVRLYMPFIGLIGLDYGYGFDYIDDDGRRHGEWVPHFQFGRTF